MAAYTSFNGRNDLVECLPNIRNEESDGDHLIQIIRDDIIGTMNVINGPFGTKPITYADWTASGRGMHKIELFMRNVVLPLYGNIHSSSSVTGHQSACFRTEARQTLAQAVNAKAEDDVVLFVGNGTTAAVNKLVKFFGFVQGCDENLRPVVFVSSYEHHSNLLPWRETSAEVVIVAYSSVSGVCLADLLSKLQRYQSRPVKVGAFSACSNVTGILTDVDEVSILLHRHGAYAVFDYASAAPYVKMDMNPVLPGHPFGPLAYKDALFFSGHKFLGGPGCPGVLVAKKALLPSLEDPPTSPGGGTVFYVTEGHHRYLSNLEEREEAGTPQLLGDVKMGLAMNVKQSVGAAWIEAEELRLSEALHARLAAIPNLAVLGRPSPADNKQPGRHLPIFSFLVRRGHRFLHFHFVAALLNDLFGVQSRGAQSPPAHSTHDTCL
mmetsp:Transcript_5629/g.7814  ORF Transcript_5629/g.7814 Transcript_5629/m.7814 type:complete len:437 (+) Transcript_5629:52-1362(+)